MAEWKEPKNDYTAAAQVTPDIFNTLAENERYLKEVKITTDQVQDASITSTQYASRTNISGTEVLKVCIGKIRKWFADLKSLAFKSIVGTSDINDSAVTDAKIPSVSASKVTGLHKVATSGDYNDLKNKPTITGGGAGTVVFNGSEKYWDTPLGFVIKPGYRYTIVCADRSGRILVADGVADDDTEATCVRFLIPSECYGGDGTAGMYFLELRNRYGAAAIRGCGDFSIEGGMDVSAGEIDDDCGYISMSGNATLTIKKIIEGSKVY